MPGNDNAPLGAGGVNQMHAGSGMLAPPSLPNAADNSTQRIPAYTADLDIDGGKS
jgi:hypothetical protein